MENPLSQRSDEELVRLTLINAAEFEPLVARHQKIVFRVIYHFLNDHHQAQDVSQECFVRAFQKLAMFDPKKGTFKTWLLTIARNLARNAIRKNVATPFRREESLSEFSVEISPVSQLQRKETVQELDRALDELAEPFRTAFILAEIEELPLAEVAAIEEVAVGTIKSRLSRARQHLRTALTSPSIEKS